MPALSNHSAQNITKMLLIGNSGSGKTSALASLALAGYNLRILDFDAGTDILLNLLKDDPAAMDRVIYEPCMDKMKNQGGTLVPDGVPKAFPLALRLLTHWKMEETRAPDGSIWPAYDLGPVSSWGEKDIIVIDSLTHCGAAAMRYGSIIAPNKDKRMDYYTAQTYVENLISMLYSSEIKCNVIVLSHITFIGEDGAERGYPAAVGKALSPKIGTYFNTILQANVIGAGAGAKRTIRTQPDGLVDLKNSAPIGMPATLPLETGLADFFSIVRKKAPAKAAPLALVKN